MKMQVALTEKDIQAATEAYIEKEFGVRITTSQTRLVIEVKSKQNYKSEWEQAAYRGMFEYDTSSPTL